MLPYICRGRCASFLSTTTVTTPHRISNASSALPGSAGGTTILLLILLVLTAVDEVEIGCIDEEEGIMEAAAAVGADEGDCTCCICCSSQC